MVCFCNFVAGCLPSLLNKVSHFIEFLLYVCYAELVCFCRCDLDVSFVINGSILLVDFKDDAVGFFFAFSVNFDVVLCANFS